MEGVRVHSPTVAREIPFMSKLTPGKQYSWCSCGLSKTQPFCDGAHKGTPFRPVRFIARGPSALLCGCKTTSSPPYCDLSHVNVIAQRRGPLAAAATAVLLGVAGFLFLR
jgi:CDGSH-type Zn-finger protein